MEKISSKIDEWLEENNFHGVISVAKGQNVFFERAYGYADINQKRLNEISTQFNVMSGSSIITTLAILKLVERGLISLDTRIQSILPGYFPYYDTTITIYHLLTHTSGIFDYFDEEKHKKYEVLWTNRPMYLINSCSDLLPLFSDYGMKYKLGERFCYTHAAYVIFGLLIEELTKQNYYAFVEKEVLEPLAMNNSLFYYQDRLPENAALGFIEIPQGYRSNIYSIPIKGQPDGGMYTTVKDIRSLWVNLLSSDFLNKDLKKEFFEQLVLVDEGEDRVYYGLGSYIISRENKDPLYKIHSHAPGVSFDTLYEAKNGLSVTAISNVNIALTSFVRSLFEVIEEEK